MLLALWKLPTKLFLVEVLEMSTKKFKWLKVTLARNVFSYDGPEHKLNELFFVFEKKKVFLPRCVDFNVSSASTNIKIYDVIIDITVRPTSKRYICLFPVQGWVTLFFFKVSQNSNNFFCLSSNNLMLNMLSILFVLILLFFIIIWIRLLALIFLLFFN